VYNPAVTRDLVPAKSGAAWSVRAGDLITIIDVEGGQTGDMFAVAADDPTDGLSNGRSLTIAFNVS
jgi:uncharacterized protein YcgI (DUF1989 family)